jgi:hypothetical protein
MSPKSAASREQQAESIARDVLEGRTPLRELVDQIEPDKASPGTIALKLISEEKPEMLYGYWDILVDLMASPNAFVKFVAIHALANLVAVDTEDKFEGTLDAYYDLLDDKSVMIASHVAGNSGKIAAAKPGLRARITQRLLEIDSTHRDPERKGLVKAYAIESLDQYFEDAEDRRGITDFVRAQLQCESPKAKKRAKQFLKKWGL